jgi:hypothetical protein
MSGIVRTSLEKRRGTLVVEIANITDGAGIANKPETAQSV